MGKAIALSEATGSYERNAPAMRHSAGDAGKDVLRTKRLGEVGSRNNWHGLQI